MSGSIGLIVLNAILFAMLVPAWQLWRQAVPKRRKVKAVEVADWPSGPDASGMDVPQPGVQGYAAPEVSPQLVGVGASPVSNGTVSNGTVSNGADFNSQNFDSPASTGFAPVAPAPVDYVDAGFAAPATPPAPVATAPVATAPVATAPAAPSPSVLDSNIGGPAAAPVSNGTIDDDELAALLNTAPPTSTAPVEALVPTSTPTTVPAAVTPVPAAVPASSVTPNSPSSLFTTTAPVSSLAPPVPVAPTGSSVGDDVSRQVGALLATPRPATQPVSSLAAPTSAPGVPQSSTGATDRLRLDITGRPVDDVMRSLATRLGEMGYNAQTGPSGGTVFQRGAAESIRIAISAQEAASTDADGRPLPARADVEVVGGQLQETTEAVLFELLDHGFQLRWAVAGELVLSSFDGALARVNVNPTSSD